MPRAGLVERASGRSRGCRATGAARALGAAPRWRGVVVDDGRLMMLIAFNNDVADAWQWADDPRYPAEKANLALRLGVNVAMYATTH